MLSNLTGLLAMTKALSFECSEIFRTASRTILTPERLVLEFSCGGLSVCGDFEIEYAGGVGWTSSGIGFPTLYAAHAHGVSENSTLPGMDTTTQLAVFAALESILKAHVDLITGGDFGDWDPETETCVKHARTAVALVRGVQLPVPEVPPVVSSKPPVDDAERMEQEMDDLDQLQQRREGW